MICVAMTMPRRSCSTARYAADYEDAGAALQMALMPPCAFAPRYNADAVVCDARAARKRFGASQRCDERLTPMASIECARDIRSERSLQHKECARAQRLMIMQIFLIRGARDEARASGAVRSLMAVRYARDARGEAPC